jgi:aminopeptidase N
MRIIILLFFSCVSLLTIEGSVNAQPDVLHYQFSLSLNDSNNRIEGIASLTVRFLRGVDSFRVDLAGRGDKDTGMLVHSIREGQKTLSFMQQPDYVLVHINAREGSEHTYVITYEGIPRDGLIISTNKFGRRTFFGDNWPDRAHQWLPCVDHPFDKAGVDFVVTAPDHYQVVANGHKTEEILLPNHLKRTHWEELVPLPTKVMVIGVADFAIDHLTDINGIPVYTYVFPENRQKGFLDYRWAADILPYYIRMIGPYAYEKLANIQSKTIFGGMENASAIFYFENSVGNRGMEELMAHEIAHQWFGDAVTETDFQHLWLSEGFATYMTHLYMEHKYGEDTLRSGLRADRNKVFALAKKRQTPVVDTTSSTGYMQLLNANSYQKGSWVLHMLRRRLGDSIFWSGIRTYYSFYGGGNATTSDFQKSMEEASGQDLGSFFRQWLFTASLPDVQVSWNYEPARKEVALHVAQLQSPAFDFPLEYKIGNDTLLHILQVGRADTVIHVSVTGPPDSVYLDPRVNLLAHFTVRHVGSSKEGNQ